MLFSLCSGMARPLKKGRFGGQPPASEAPRRLEAMEVVCAELSQPVREVRSDRAGEGG